MMTKVSRVSVRTTLTNQAAKMLRTVLRNATDNIQLRDKQTAMLLLNSSCIAIVDDHLNSAEVYDLVDTHWPNDLQNNER